MSYCPAEVLLGHCSYGIGVDIWGLGCVFAEMFIKDVLFYDENETKLIYKIFKKVGTPDFLLWEETKIFCPNNFKFPKFTKTGFSYIKKINQDFDDIALDLLEKMLNPNPTKRPNCKIIKSHPFFKDYLNNLNK